MEDIKRELTEVKYFKIESRSTVQYSTVARAREVLRDV